MLRRCETPTTTHYERYGGRGIKICERWHTFENFLSDMGECPDGLTLDRIDNDGNYEPGNCRWATRKEQAMNTSSTTFITFRGERKTAEAWAQEIGIKPAQLKRRIKQHGLEVAMTAPPSPGKPVVRTRDRAVKLTPEVVESALLAFEQGEQQKAIASRLGVNHVRLCAVLNGDVGWIRNPQTSAERRVSALVLEARHRWAPRIDIAEAADLLAQGWSLRAIAERQNTNHTTLCAVLKRAGVRSPRSRAA